MPSLDLLIAFLVATSIFAYIPGPSTLYAAAQTIAKGRRTGWFAVMGIHLGGYVHVFAAAVGLAVLFEAVPTMYLALKLAGAAYLIWLGVKMFLSKKSAESDTGSINQKSAKGAFWESVSVEVLNPKTAIFYVAFLPQFVDPSTSLAVWAQFLILGTGVNLVFSSADALCVILADKVVAFFKSSDSANRLAQRLGGSILVGLGVNLALDR
ncbi:MAG: LysE family translocator [Sneathiella sp.]